MKPIKNKRKTILFLFFLFFSLFLFSLPVKGKECNEGDPRLDEICRQLNQLNQQYHQLKTAIAGAQKSLEELEREIKRIRQTITATRKKIKIIEKEVFEKEVEAEFQKKLLFARVKNHYIKSRQLSPLLLFLASENLTEAIKQIGYFKAAREEDKKIILSLTHKINQLSQEKKSLEEKSTQLENLEKKLDDQASLLEKDIKGALAYGQQLTAKIAQLTAEQERILAEKTGVFQTSVGETPTVDDPCSGPPGADNFCSPGFSPAFAAFSFGAPHRKGMSQYGAYGRAKSGQNHETILRAYYGAIRLETISSPANIATDRGTLPFEENYLYGIAEMPSVWGKNGGMEALKAQAIAARTYALSYTGWRLDNPTVKKSICTTEACQVYSPAKAANPPAEWKQAVDETRGKIIVSQQTNQIISSWYASTSGGYLYSYSTLGHQTPGGWDTVCGNQSCWPDQAYEKISHSPWFYKGWYRTRSGKSCGRSHPWLNQQEFADIVNALLVYTHDQGSLNHLSQTDSCWGKIAETWSQEELRSQATRFGGPVSTINHLSVSYSSNGYTAEVKIQTDKGEFVFSGNDFKLIFNLRAPGALHLKSRLFNLVKI